MKVCSLCGRCNDDSSVYCAEGCQAPLSQPHDAAIEMIDGYRLDTLLESDSRVELYRARHIASDRSCLIRLQPRTQKSREKFLREAEVATSFFHPNVVDIYEAGMLEAGQLFVVAEDPEGRTLREFLNDIGTPDLLMTIQILRQAAEALHAMHLKDLIHRALRPENIILTTDDAKRLLVRIQNADIGGAIQSSVISDKFSVDSAIHLLRYFAPEQCGENGASVRTDVYSLGIILFELLTGSPPFDAPKAAGLVQKHRTEHPPDVRIDNFELRMLVTHTLSEALQKRPDVRQATADLFARQLRHIEQLATHVSTPPPAGSVPRAPMRSAPRINITSGSFEPPLKPVVHAIKRDVEVPEVIVESAPVRVPKIEPTVVATFEEEVEQQVSVAEVPVVESEPAAIVVEEKAQPRVPRVSRLKIHKKKLREKLVHATDAIREVLPTFEATPAPQILTVAQDKPAETMTVQRKKIEWVQPEDDIPSMEDVLEVMAKEQVDEVPAVVAAIDKPVDEAPALVVAIDKPVVAPVDDIAVNDSLQVATTPIVEVEAVGKTHEAESVAPIPTWVATMAEKFATALKDIAPIPSSPRIAVVPGNAETEREIVKVKKPVAKIASKPARAERQPEAKIVTAPPPVRKRVPPVNAKPAPVELKPFEGRIPWMKAALSRTPKEVTRIPVVRDELEEITLVRPPRKPIKIDLETFDAAPTFSPYKKFAAQVPDETGYFPTLLGGVTTTNTAVDDSMFSGFETQRSNRLTLGRRSLAAGIGSVIVVLLFLFGDDVVSKFVQTASTENSVASKQETVETTAPTIAVSAPEKKSAKTPERSTPERAKQSSETPRDTKASAPVKTETKTSSPPRATPPLEKKEAKTKPEKRPVQDVLTPVKSSASTRPRIVKEN